MINKKYVEWVALILIISLIFLVSVFLPIKKENLEIKSQSDSLIQELNIVNAELTRISHSLDSVNKVREIQAQEDSVGLGSFSGQIIEDNHGRLSIEIKTPPATKD